MRAPGAQRSGDAIVPVPPVDLVALADPVAAGFSPGPTLGASRWVVAQPATARAIASRDRNARILPVLRMPLPSLDLLAGTRRIRAYVAADVVGAFRRLRGQSVTRDSVGAPARRSPSGPPGNAGAAGVGGTANGAVGGAWFAILLCFVTSVDRVLRRHGFSLVSVAPRGVVVVLQRPG